MAEKSELKPVPVRKRTAARLGAIQVNYEKAMSDKDMPHLMAQYLSHYANDAAKEMQVKKIDEGHFNELTALMADNQNEIDQMIAELLDDDWSLDRLARHDLSALRAAVAELKFMPHIPAKAIISEYASLTDAYQGDVKFANAIMDRLARSLRKLEMAK
ncbi:MAG: transcription antitermination factor NusB [Candidatus Puniceispirillaceae bacterium]